MASPRGAARTPRYGIYTISILNTTEGLYTGGAGRGGTVPPPPPPRDHTNINIH